MLTSAQYGRLLEPGLRKIFNEAYREVPEQYTLFLNVQESDKAIETDLRMGGFGLWDKKDSGGSVVYDDVNDPIALQYIHEEFAKGFIVERKLIDDEMGNQIAKKPQKLAKGARATIETKAAEILNTAFTRNGFDGVPLISKDHVRLDGGKMSNSLGEVPTGSGLTAIGVANGALSDRNLKSALIMARKQVDDKGILIQCQPKKLLVPPELEFVARTIVGGANLSANGTGSGMTNDINAIQSRLEVVVLDYLTSDKAWFVVDPTVAELNFFWRKRLEFGADKDFDTHQAKFQGYMRFSCGYSDYRGIVGSTGTGAA